MTDHQTQIVKILDYYNSLETYTINQNTSQTIAPSINVSYLKPDNPHYSSKDEVYQLHVKATSKENREAIVKSILQLDSRYPNGYKWYYNDTAAYLTFTTDEVGTTPSQITSVDTDLTVGVVAAVSPHTKCFQFNQTARSSIRDDGFIILFTTADQTIISIEFYLYWSKDDTGTNHIIRIKLDDTNFFRLAAYDGSAYIPYSWLYKEGNTVSQKSNLGTGFFGWHHHRFEIEAGSNKWYLDGVLTDSNTGFTTPSFSSMKIEISNDQEPNYLENIDFSWDNGYYTNRSISGTLSVDTNYPHHLTMEMLDEWDTEAYILCKARWAV